DQIGVQTEYRSEAFAGTAGAIGVVETKKIDGRQFKTHSVQLKHVGKFLPHLSGNEHNAISMAFEKRGLHAVRNPKLVVLIVLPHHRPVYEYFNGTGGHILFRQ